MDEQKKVTTVWYDFLDRDGGVIHRGNKIIGQISIKHAIDSVPTMKLVLPMSEVPKMNLNTIEIKVHLGDKYTFYGLIDGFENDYAAWKTTLDLSHIVAKHRKDFMPVNLIVKNMPLKNLYNNMDFNLPDFEYIFSEKAASTRIEYTFSSENKLKAIDDALSQTEDIHWRVRLRDEKRVEFSEFGRETPVVISQTRAFPDECLDTQNHLYYPTMLTEPIFSMNFTEHFNRAVVLCGDIGEGVLHMTLKYIYEHPELQDPLFPVGMYEKNINQQPEPEYDDTGSKDNVGDTPRVAPNTPLTKTDDNLGVW